MWLRLWGSKVGRTFILRRILGCGPKSLGYREQLRLWLRCEDCEPCDLTEPRARSENLHQKSDYRGWRICWRDKPLGTGRSCEKGRFGESHDERLSRYSGREAVMKWMLFQMIKLFAWPLTRSFEKGLKDPHAAQRRVR